MDPRLDHEDLVVVGVDGSEAERFGVEHLLVGRNQEDDVAVAEGDGGDPVVAEAFIEVFEGAGDPRGGTARRREAADFVVEGVARHRVGGRQGFQRGGRTDRAVERLPDARLGEGVQDVGCVAGTIAVVADRHGCLPRGDGRRHDPRALLGAGVGAQGEVLADAPDVVVHVVSDPVREFLVAVGHHLDGGAHVGDIGPRIAIEDAHVGVVLARLPAPRPLHDVHGRGLTGPLQHGRGDDPRLPGRRGRHVFASRRDPQRARGPLPLDVGVVVGKTLGHHGEIGMLEELAVFVAVKVERAGDGNVGPDEFAEAAGDLGFGTGNVADRHGAVQREVHPVHRHLALQVGQHQVHEVVEGLLRVPASRGAAEDTHRRSERHEFDVTEFARPPHETPDVGAGFQQRVPRDGLADPQPVLDFGVAAGAEGAGLVLEPGHRDAEPRFARRRSTGGTHRRDHGQEKRPPQESPAGDGVIRGP